MVNQTAAVNSNWTRRVLDSEQELLDLPVQFLEVNMFRWE
jgi:hypothetical protein